MAAKRRSKNTEALFRDIIRGTLPPPPDLTVSEWADAYRKLSSESSAEPGQWRTDRAPYQRAIMDAVNDPELEKIVIMSSAQVGKTELILNTLGYHIDFDPAPIMIMQPTVALAQSFSKERLAPMIRDTPAIKNKVSDAKSRDSGNTTLQKSFPGGYVAMVGANAPSGLASRPIRILLADEIDRFPVSAGTEGDPLSLAEKRTNNFYNRKKIFVSTPTNKGTSRIEVEYELSTKERWNLACPSCDAFQPLKWAQIIFDSHSAACEHCGAVHNEYEWKSQPGKWIQENPGARSRGFHLNELVSPWKKWHEIIAEFLEAKKKGQEAMKVWVNTSLGETWEEEGEEVDADGLDGRRERYAAEVPEGVSILTAAVDTQDDRFEIEVVGWGRGKESWGIEYQVIYGDLNQPQIWNDLDEYLSRTWAKQDGRRFGISCTCMDSGGHFTQEVYRFTKARETRRIYAIKGKSAKPGDYTPLVAGYSRTKLSKAILVSLGVDDGKARIMSNLQLEEVGPNYCHFPEGRGYGTEYFKGLTAERLETRYEKGIPYKVWRKVRNRNEPLDVRVYNIAALEILNPNLEKEYAIGTVKRKKKRRKSTRGVT
ncbi:phage terminase large subunit family protein [Exiguobacterium sp. s192]|uniref:phage terminase large subunit family protein n=1 Tax=Exiguobacterium sp. s192 TaxID=2751206 RepID=UPI001BE980BF